MFITTLKKAATALLLIGSVGLAQATTTVYDFSGLSSTEQSFSTSHSSASFDDVYSVTLASGNTGVIGGFFGATTDLSTTFSFSASLDGIHWSSAMPVPAPVFPDDGSFGYGTTVSGLTAGTPYYFKLSGSNLDGGYTIHIAAVPEPETYAMLLAGLGLMGSIARRRNRTSTK